MKSHGGLWKKVLAPENLRESMRLAARGKRSRYPVQQFLDNADEELECLRDELTEEIYQPLPYTSFRILDPKPRMIRCAAFRDRVVQHALCDVCSPFLDRRFIFDCYACRKNKGTHAAVRRAQEYSRRFRYALHLDVRSFFDSVNVGLCIELLARSFREREILTLWEILLRHSWPGKDSAYGLAIGSLTSQWAANLYLDGLDHQIKEIWRFKGYLRYMDDMVLFADSKDELWWARNAVDQWLGAERGLALKSKGEVLLPVHEGVAFLGLRVFPGSIRLQGSRLRRMRKSLERALSLDSVDAHMALLRAWGIPDLACRQTKMLRG